MLTQKVQSYNLPSQPTPFIGRETEISEIVELLQDERCRLLTLLGAGGIGKTRLSIESIQHLTTNNFEHGVFYVPLAPLTSADNIAITMIGVLGIMIGDNGTPQEELVKFLKGRNLLLVMDNFEHVLDRADLVADILNHAPNVKIIATSRESLNLRMEQVWHVSGMTFPNIEQVDEVEQYGAIQLFVDCATRVRLEFSLENNLFCVIRICRLVEGMPLAIELAASWLKSLSCWEIVKEIEHGIDFLATRARDIQERHRSIRAVFDHSWSLLTPDEQTIFPRLFVFRGGFTREAAAKVADAELLTLSGLVEKSMVHCDETGRYYVHELLRQYAEEKLKTVGEVDDTLLAYVSYFAEFMATRAIDIKGRRQLEGLDEIDADLDHVVDAWYHAIDQVDYPALDNMMEALALYYDLRGRYQVGEDLFQLALDRLADLNKEDVTPTYNRLRVRYVQVWVLPERHPIPESIHQLIADGLSTAEMTADVVTTMICYWLKIEIMRIQSDYDNTVDAFTEVDHVLHLAQESGDPYYEGRVLRPVILMCITRANKSTDFRQMASKYLHHALELAQRTSDTHTLAYLTTYAGYMAEEINQEIQYLSEGLSIFQTMNDRKNVGANHIGIGTSYAWMGKFKEAFEHYFNAEQLLGQVNFPRGYALSYARISWLYCLEENYDQALHYAELAGKQATWARHFGMAFYCTGQSDLTTARYHVSMYLKTRVIRHWYRDMVIIGACILQQDGQLIRAVEILGLLLTHPAIVTTDWLNEWRVVRELQVDLKAELGDEVYKVAWERGNELDIERAIQDVFDYICDDVAPLPKVTSQPLADPLTPKEMEVLALLAHGLTNPQIADKLTVSKGTIHTHMRHIREKLAVNSRTAAVVKGRDLGLI